MKTILIIFLLIAVIKAQNPTNSFSGYLYDLETGEPIVGANVLITDPATGSSTDENGYFYIDSIPDGEHIIKIACVGYIIIVDSIRFTPDNFHISRNYKLQFAITEFEITQLEEFTAYHTNLKKSAAGKNILEFVIDSIKVMKNRTYFYSTFKNNTAFPIYILQEKECIRPFEFEIWNSAGEVMQRNLVPLDCDNVMFYNPDSSDLIRIPPFSSYNYDRTKIWLYDFQSFPKDKYEVKISYEYKDPMKIMIMRNTNIDRYSSEIYAARVALRGKYYSENVMEIIN